MRDPSSLEQTRPRTRVCNAVANLQIEVPRFDIPTPLSCLPPAALGTRICFAALVVDDREGGPYRKAAATALGSVGLANVRVTRGKRYRAGSPCLPFFRFEVDDVASHSLFPIVDAQVALMEPLPADDEKAGGARLAHGPDCLRERIRHVARAGRPSAR
ncbi:hypothetical protein P171DRAFT_427110 [Karstenula rhodostoma CBS 690.94]|uniref:Uncharacterized protein n=1 Tax=Karstenula rhodostoma CBS 690.94 TaxID=1392251 RepID=A0A9P4PXQ5_9PLEO|nr:hypothetical protein P171DRAFT_427110 [Karstenula rhodostoma CBS 690.94]